MFCEFEAMLYEFEPMFCEFEAMLYEFKPLFHDFEPLFYNNEPLFHADKPMFYTNILFLLSIFVEKRIILLVKKVFQKTHNFQSKKGGARKWACDPLWGIK